MGGRQMADSYASRVGRIVAANWRRVSTTSDCRTWNFQTDTIPGAGLVASKVAAAMQLIPPRRGTLPSQVIAGIRKYQKCARQKYFSSSEHTEAEAVIEAAEDFECAKWSSSLLCKNGRESAATIADRSSGSMFKAPNDHHLSGSTFYFTQSSVRHHATLRVGRSQAHSAQCARSAVDSAAASDFSQAEWQQLLPLTRAISWDGNHTGDPPNFHPANQTKEIDGILNMLICAILSPAENAPRQLKQAHDNLAATEAAESATNRTGAARVANAVEQRHAKCMSARIALEGWRDSVGDAAQAATREAKEAAVAHSTAQKELISFCEKSNIPVEGMFLTAVRDMSLYDKLIYTVSARVAQMEAGQHEAVSSMSQKLPVAQQKGTSSPLSVQAEADARACRERDAEEARQEFKLATSKLIQRRQARLDLLRRLHDRASATAGRTLGRAAAVTGRLKAMTATLKAVLPN